MAKKIKPNKLFDDSLKDSDDQSKETSQEASIADMIGADANAIVGNGRLSAEDAKKLEQYDAMEKSLASISQEKEMLEVKVAEYVEKLDSLKESSTKIAELEEANKKLSEKCKQLEDKYAKSSQLERENKSLRDENDQYLIKISELTFENANLTCQLSEFEKRAKANGNGSNQGQFMPANGMQHQLNNGLAAPNRDAYNAYVNNGYGTW